MGISRKQYRLLAQASLTKQGAKMMLERAGDEPSPDLAYDKIATVIQGGINEYTETPKANDGVKPIEPEVSESQPKKTRTPKSTAKKELQERIELNYRKFEDMETLQKAIREEVGVKYVSLNDFGVERANQYAEGIYDMVKKFPTLRDHIKFFGGMKSFYQNLKNDIDTLDQIKTDVEYSDGSQQQNRLDYYKSKLTNPLSLEVYDQISSGPLTKDWEKAIATTAVLSWLKRRMDENLNRYSSSGSKIIDTLGGQFYVFSKNKGSGMMAGRPPVKEKSGFDGVTFNDVAPLKDSYVQASLTHNLSPVIAKYPEKFDKYIASHELSHVLDMKLLRDYQARAGVRGNVASGNMFAEIQLLGADPFDISQTSNLSAIIKKNMPTKEQIFEINKRFYNFELAKAKQNNYAISSLNYYEEKLLSDYDDYIEHGRVSPNSTLAKLVTRHYVGEYANKNVAELFAESLATVMIDEQPNQFVKDIVNAVIGPGGYTL